MPARLARLSCAHPRAVLVAFGLAVVGGVPLAVSAATDLSPAGYEVSGSESTRAAETLARDFDTGAANVVVLATAPGPGGVDAAPAIAAGLQLGDRLRAVGDVGEVVSYWETGAPQLRGADGRQAIVTARIVADEHTVYERVEEIRDELGSGTEHLEVAVGGSAAVNLEIVEQSERDLVKAELLVVPLTTVVMLLVFRSVLAAVLPFVVAAVSVVGTAVFLRVMSEATLVSVFALNLTTALGLGMAVDYSLFLISRWREERAAGAEPTDAVERAVTVAGRAILFSGLTTAATLAALVVFDYPLLRSLAFAGLVVVLLASLAALLALPAAMVLLGDRIDAWSLRRPASDRPVEDGRWFRFSQAVMRRPWPVIVVTVAVLLVVGWPFLRAEFGLPDDRVLPAGLESRDVADDLRAGFDAHEFGALAVVVADRRGASDAELAAYAADLSEVDGVARVESAAGIHAGGAQVGASRAERFTSDDGAWYSIVPEVEPVSAAGERLVGAVRSLPSPAPVLVGGESARLVDNKAEIAAKLPWVMAWIGAVIFALLYWTFRSIVVPIKAVLLNLLSLTAAFGAVVWVFQDGRLAGVLGYTPTGLTDAQTPVLMFCIAFGLSMDYEVFLLSRIREEWDRCGDLRRSVSVGLQRTGGIISAAAILMAVVFLSFATGEVTFIQMVGIGLALSILMDAVIVRSLLVPAFMAVAGRWNWWSPFERSPVRAASHPDGLVPRPLVTQEGPN